MNSGDKSLLMAIALVIVFIFGIIGAAELSASNRRKADRACMELNKHRPASEIVTLCKL